jgi:hypothetical protein
LVKIKKKKLLTPKKMGDDRDRVSLMGRIFIIDEN